MVVNQDKLLMLSIKYFSLKCANVLTIGRYSVLISTVSCQFFVFREDFEAVLVFSFDMHHIPNVITTLDKSEQF